MAKFFTHVGNSLQPKNKLEQEVIALFNEKSNLILKTTANFYPVLFISEMEESVLKLSLKNPRCKKVEVSWLRSDNGGMTLHTTNGFVTMQIFKSKN